MSMPGPGQSSPVANEPPHDGMERVHTELAILYLSALMSMAGSIGDLLSSAGIKDDEAQDEARRVLRRALAEARECLSRMTGRSFDAIVDEFLRSAQAAAPDARILAPALLERILRVAS